MIRNFLVGLFIIFISAPAIADDFKSEDELRPFLDGFMKKIFSDDMSGAFKLARPYLAITEPDFQLAELNTKNQKAQYNNKYGFTLDCEFIEYKKVGSSLIRVVYIEKTEKQALPWIFYFYKPSTAWVLSGFKFGDQLLSGILDGK
jgi:hypothetical protein